MTRTIYTGHNHYVQCDGLVHVSHTNMPEKFPAQVQCRCFCQDPEFLAHGFSMDLMRRYSV